MTWKIADNETDTEDAVKLWVTNHEQLGLPYPFQTLIRAINYFIYQNNILLCKDCEGKPAGVAAFALGTEEDDYSDWSKIEIYSVFLLHERCYGRLFLRGLQAMVELLLSFRQVQTIAFYLPPDHSASRLVKKFAVLEKTVERQCGTLNFYSARLTDLQSYTKSYG